jgi:hypothetical protein
VISFESDLYRALKNAGTLNSGSTDNPAPSARVDAADTAEHPIKPMIIGTGNDPQIAAALDFLQKAVGREAGTRHGSPGGRAVIALPPTAGGGRRRAKTCCTPRRNSAIFSRCCPY